eukprot:s3611_g8.t1
MLQIRFVGFWQTCCHVLDGTLKQVWHAQVNLGQRSFMAWALLAILVGFLQAMSSVTDSSAVSWNSQVTEEEARRKEKKERKSRKHRQHSADAHADRPAKKDDGALPKPYNWAEEVVKASLDPQNQWEFPAASGKAGYVGSLAAWEQPRARGTEVASRARERAEEVQRWERHHDSQQQYIFGTPR